MERWRPYFTFRGRSSRLTYWRVQLVGVLVAAALILITVPMIMYVGRPSGLLLLLLAPMIVAVIATSVRRLHDRNRSGWWLVGYLAVPGLVSSWAQDQLKDAAAVPATVALALLLSLGLTLWSWLDVGFLRGTTGVNMFGDDPRP